MLVFTNGCFDLLHTGHFHLLNTGKMLAGSKGRLVVGLNSDASVRRVKGPPRPIITQEHRKYCLQGIKWVDEVIVFDEDTPAKLIEYLRPDILLKGAEWEGQKIAGSEFVRLEVKFAPMWPEQSTTAIIGRIIESYAKGL